jgi:gliding motility-associated-like protein
VTVTVNITVTPVNDVPVVTSPAITTPEDTPQNGTITVTDVDGGTPVFSVTTPPANGTVTVNPDGTYTYTPNLNYNGPDTFTVTVSDGNGGTTTVTIPVTVTPVNDAPSGTGDTKTTAEDVPVTGAVSGTDVDGDVLSYTKATDPANGTVVVNGDGTYTYTPNKDYNGTDVFTITISDGKGGDVTVTVNITVTPVNDVPVVTSPAITTPEDTPQNGTITVTDVDGGTPVFSVTTPPANGTVTVNTDGTYTYTPNLNYNGPDTFTVTVSDGNGGTTTVTIPVTVTPVNDAPVATSPAITTPEDTPQNGTITVTDVDGGTPVFSVTTPPANGTVTVNTDGTYTYTPNKDYNGPDTFTVTVSDGNGGSTTVTIPVTVTPVNDLPSGTGDTKTTAEDVPVTGAVSGTDVDGDVLSYTKATDPANGTVVVNGDGTYTYTPNKDYNGTDVFTITISDGKGGNVTVTVNITVTPVNDVPVVTSPVITTPEDTPQNGTITVTDVDGGTPVFSVTTPPANGTVTVNTDGTYTYTPNLNYNGPDTFTVTVSDGNGGTTTVTIPVTVTPVNDAPVATSPNISTNADLPATGKVIASDADGDTLSYTVSTPPVNGTVVINPDGTYTYTPKPGFNGSDSFTVTVSDGKGGTVTVNISVTVIFVPRPSMTVVKVGVATQNTITYTFTIKNTGNVTLVNFILDDARIGINGKAIAIPGGLLPGASTNITEIYTLTQADRESGSVSNSATISAQDGNGTVARDITGTADGNDLPTLTEVQKLSVANNDSYETNANKAIVNDVITNDVTTGQDLSKLKVDITMQPMNGRVTINSDGTVTYTPNPGFTGDDSYHYRLVDEFGYYSNVATVNIKVNFFGIRVPNLFTPNGDGINDVLEIRGLNQFEKAELSIVNRWGNEVYKSNNYQNDWNGEGLNEGTYYYLLKVKRNAASEWEIFKGYTTLIRTFKK